MTTLNLPYRALDKDAAAASGRHGDVPPRLVELHDVALRWRTVAVSAAAEVRFVPGNVVPFDWGRRDPRAARPAPEVKADPAVRVASAAPRPAHLLLLLAASVAGHAALYLPFYREPAPMASIGIETISVEIVLGANEDAGLEKHNGTAAASAPPPAQAPDVTQAPQALREPPAHVAKLATPRDVPPAQPDEVKAAPVAETEPAETKAGVRAEAVPVEQATEQMETAAAKPLAPLAGTTTTAPEVTAHVQPPMPIPRVKRRKPRRATPQAVARGERNHSASSAPAETAAGGVGRGRSDMDTNYRGRVAAHLARHKQFPAEARRSGDHGRAVVSFSLSGSGNVTSVRLVRGTGVPSLDRESVAMVRRASPFPAPPDGRSVSFTVPVNFQLR